MKVGEVKVKRNYSIVQIIIDVATVIMLVIFYQLATTFKESAFLTTQHYDAVMKMHDGNFPFWQLWIFPLLALITVAISLLFIYRNKPKPKKRLINETDMQKYSDIYVDCVALLRIISLFAILDMMFIQWDYFSFGKINLFSKQIIIDIIIGIFVIRFSRNRFKKISTPVYTSNKK